MPLLSVVIPTYKRPRLVSRAIDSALRFAPDGDVEVLVIPNGRDDSWRSIASTFAKDSRVQWHSITASNANVARNHGLALAAGKFVRFLDDDDYLLSGAMEQCVALASTQHDVSQGVIEQITPQGIVLEEFVPFESDDFLHSVLSGRIFTLLHSFLWRRDRIARYSWNPRLPAAQDVAWTLGIAKDMELSAHYHHQPVGAWVYHSRESTSRKASQLTHDRVKAEVIVDLALGLEDRSALSETRRSVIGTNLWNCIHGSFPLAPLYWTRIAFKAMKLSPDSRPDIDAFARLPFSLVPPLAIELLSTPHRFIRHLMRVKPTI